MRKTRARFQSCRTLLLASTAMLAVSVPSTLNAQAATYTPYGSGCMGSTGTIPRLSNDNGSLPRIGKVFIQRLDRYTGTPFALLGVSDQTWNGRSLPIDLSPAGMPGCQLLTSGEVPLLILAIGNGTLVAFTIPNNPVLLGKTFYCQGAFTDVLANPLGVVVSNAAASTIGQ